MVSTMLHFALIFPPIQGRLLPADPPDSRPALPRYDLLLWDDRDGHVIYQGANEYAALKALRVFWDEVMG